ncbi:uncharacterized protein LOC135690827 isoform X2 [Rhopilema esculentum]
MLLNFRDNDAGTGLHYATKLDRADMVRSLLAAGANPTLKNCEGATPLDYCKSEQMKNAYVGALMQAVAQSKQYRVSLLLEAGVDVNAGDGADSDNKVLHWAASFGDLETIKLLLEYGADVNAVNGDGSTALHDAIIRDDKAIVLELLNHGANINIVPFKGAMEGKSCYDIAVGKEDILTILEVHLLTNSGNVNGDHRDQEEETVLTLEDTASTTELKLSTPIGASKSNHDSSKNLKEQSPTESIPKQKQFQPILLPPKSPMRLFLPTMTKLDPGVLQLWPPPQNILQYKGTFYVPPINLKFLLMVSRNTSSAHLTCFNKLMQVLQPKLQSLGLDFEAEISCPYTASSSSIKGCIECFIDSSTIFDDEEYKLCISTKKVKIIAGGMKALFYALNTFVQCLRIFQGKGLPLLQISDAPETRIRGVQLDFRERDLPKFEYLLYYIDVLSGFKINQIFIPAQLFLPDEQKRFTGYNSRDLLQLHSFCQDRFIELVPSLRCADVLDPVTAISYASIKLEILPLFPSTRFLSISLDDLDCSSKENQNVLSGITDNDMVRRIEELHEFCVSNVLTLLLDSEIILQQPVRLMDISHNLICLNMLREGKKELTTEYLADLGVAHLISPSYEDHRTLINDVRSSLKCFENSQRTLKKSGSLGVVLRSPIKSMSLCCLTLDFVSIAICSAMSWRSSPVMVLDEDMLTAIINRHIYEDDNDIIGNLVLTLSSIEQISLISKESYYNSTGESSSPNTESAQFGQLKELLNATDELSASSLSFENLKISAISLKQLEDKIGKSKIKSRFKELLTSELNSLLKIMGFLCKFGLALQKPKTNTTADATVLNLSQIQRSDLSNKLMNLLEQYEAFSTTYYKETPDGLMAVELLRRLIKRLYPEGDSSFLGSIVRTFTV